MENIKENKMGTMPIPKLLVSIALPMIISMMVQALYNVVDSIFVARLGEDALSAVSLTFPIQNLMIAVSVGTGIAINAIISRFLGAKDLKRAGSVAKNGMFLALLSFIAFALIGILGSRMFFAHQTSNQVIVDYGSQYMFIVCSFSIGLFFQITFERIVQATGRTVLNMIMQGTGAIINIILDPILIFGLFGFPRLEVAGAAVATVTGQIVAAILGYFFVIKYAKEVDINLKGFRPDKGIIKSIYQIGLPSIVMQSIGSIMVFGMNIILLMFSTTATAVFGIYFKLQSFIFMPVFGLTNGLVSIVAFNYGAGNKKRILESYKLTIIVACTFMCIGTIVFQVFTRELLLMFDASENMMEMGVTALRVISYSFILAGFAITSSALFQALGKAMYSLFISVTRQLVFILPIAYVLAMTGGLQMVWWSLTIAEVLSLALCIFLVKHIYNNTIKKIQD